MGGTPDDYARGVLRWVEAINRGADPGAKLREVARKSMTWEGELAKVAELYLQLLEMTAVRHLIINADGYGFTAGITRAIEECVEFGTVRSLSANVNFGHAAGLDALVRRHPEISVGCHINPIVGRPILPVRRSPRW